MRNDTVMTQAGQQYAVAHAAHYETKNPRRRPMSSCWWLALSMSLFVATAVAAGPPFVPFDATIPESLADLRSGRVVAGGTASIGESYRSFVAALGQQTASALGSAISQQGLVDAAERSRQSSHGVSVDEEMVHLMEAQRMYEAAARVITTVDQALDTLINRTGMVGR